jgi:hypothetical protein
MPPQPPAKSSAPLAWGIIGVIVLVLCLGCFGFVAVSSETDTATPTASGTPAETTAAAETTKAPKPTTFDTISDRQWKRVARDPESHEGEAIIVHGLVTQADAATGTDYVRASVGGRHRAPQYGWVDYPVNTLLTGGPIGDLVTGDLFTARVVVRGSVDYDTALGGSTSAPLLTVIRVKTTGSIDI